MINYNVVYRAAEYLGIYLGHKFYCSISEDMKKCILKWNEKNICNEYFAYYTLPHFNDKRIKRE